MALNFYTQGVDFSGLGQGIARGLEQAANMRMQQEQIVRKEIDDFKSTYDTNKIMSKDIPLFASEFDNYRNTAIEYAKMNRRRVKPSEIAAKKAQLDAVKGKLNKVYTDSAMAGSVLDGLVKYADRMTAAGYALPDDMNRDIIMYKTQPIDKIDFTKAKSPADYQFEANEKDFVDLDRVISTIPSKKSEYTVGEAFSEKVGNETISIPEKEKFSIKDPGAVLGKIGQSFISDVRLKNAAINQKNTLISNLNNTSTDEESLIRKKLAQNTADKILKAYPELNGDIKKVFPEMVVAASRGFLDTIPLGRYVSMKEFEAKFKNVKETNKELYNKLKADIKGKNQSVSTSLMKLAIETGGEFLPSELEDLGYSKQDIERMQLALISYKQRIMYNPGTLIAPRQ